LINSSGTMDTITNNAVNTNNTNNTSDSIFNIIYQDLIELSGNNAIQVS